MASKQARIPIPLSQRLRRARYRLVPLLIFSLAVAGTVWLWDRQTAMPNAVGAVEAVRHDIASPASGVLVWDSAPLETFDHVTENQVIARLDDSSVRADLAVVKADLAESRAKIVALEAQLKLDDNQRKENLQIDARRMALDLERMRLTLLDRRAELESERIALSRRDEQMAAMKRLVDSNAATEVDLLNLKLLRDVSAQKAASLEQTVKEIQQQLTGQEQRIAALPAGTKSDLDAMIAPLRDAVTAQQARITVLEQQAQSLVIRAPAAGVISEIFRRPGQPVRAGDPILVIADPQARRVISYVRVDQRITPKPEMEVLVRSRTDPRQMYRSKVAIVGPQFESVPRNQLRSQTVPEWGLPVSIDLPSDSKFRPGEVVDLVLLR